MQIFQNIATVIGCLSTCIAFLITIIKPLRQWLVDSISRKANQTKISQTIDELDKKMDQSLINDKQFDERLTRVEQNVLENEADRLRSELFNCGNRCRRGIRLHPEEMDHIHDVFRKYSENLHQNGTGKKEYDFIVEYYNHQTFPAYHTKQND